jgi:Mg/Co/Ni transporter MgtE
MVLDLLVFIAGIAYGYINPGKESRGKLLKKGLRIGIVLGAFLAILNLLIGGIMAFGATLIGTVVGIALLTVIFVGGTIVGDWFEERFKK